MAPPKLRAPILGALLDLSETPSAIPHLTAWRGDDGIPLAKLLCRVWREEEAAIGVKRDEKGNKAMEGMATFEFDVCMFV